jgi:hypothetical protein
MRQERFITSLSEELSSLVCFWGVGELGISKNQLALRFGISQPAASMAVSRGEQLAKDWNFSII